jgi:hypothetical protein
MRSRHLDRGSRGPVAACGRGHARAAALAACLLLLAPGVWADEEPPAEGTAAAEAAASAETPQGASAESQEDAELTRQIDMGFDAVVLRPMGFAQFLIGSVILPPAWLLSWPGGGQGQVLDILFQTPFDYTFRRPLGEF